MMKTAILMGLLLGMMHGAAHAQTTPQFTTGTSTSRTESKQTITETFIIESFSTADSYTMTSTNIEWDGPPRVGANYTQIDPGAPTQFTETVMIPGLTERTELVRTTTIDSVTTTTSVFQ